MIQTIQKIIKVGNSWAVTIPVKDMRNLKLHYGDKVKISIEALEPEITSEDIQMIKLGQKLIKRHAVALKHLAER